MTMDKVRAQGELARAVVAQTLRRQDDFCGSLRLNFQHGRIVNINKEETVKAADLPS